MDVSKQQKKDTDTNLICGFIIDLKQIEKIILE
jgi:hypothetical protein